MTHWLCSRTPFMPLHPDRVRIESADIQLTIDPSRGARAVSWRVGPLELLAHRSSDPVEHGMYPMAPWAGRLRGNVVDHGGRRRALPVTYDRWALHGTVLGRAASSVSTDADGAGLTATFDSHPEWPWPISIVVRWRVGDGAVETGIEVRALVDPCPVVVGWHPWFRRDLGVGGRAVWELPATARLERGTDHLPTGAAMPFTPEDGPFDDAFVVPSGHARVRWPGALELDVESDGGWYVIFDELPDVLCIEPQSGPPDGLRDDAPPTALGPVTLAQPGHPVTLSTRWIVSR